MCSRFLVISDIHGSKKCLNKIKAAYHKYDPEFSVICGDITHFGSLEDGIEILEKIPTDVLGVIGNCDPAEIESSYDKTGNRYIELKRVKKNGIDFIGLSGSDYSREKVELFKERSKGADVYVFHQPPYGYLDDASRGKHIGSKQLVSVVEENDPRLVLSGHVHEDRGIVRENETVFMNPGPAGDDDLGLVEMKDGEVNARLP